MPLGRTRAGMIRVSAELPAGGAMPTIVGTPTVSISTSVVIPAVTQAGDLILVCEGSSTTTATLNSPTGIGTLSEIQTKLVSTDTSAPVLNYCANLWAKIADGTEAGLTVTAAVSAGTAVIACIVLRGIHATLWNEDIETAVGGNESLPTAPTITTAAAANRRVVMFRVIAESDGSWHGNWTGGSGPDYSEHANAGTATGFDRTVSVYSAEAPTASTTISGKVQPYTPSANLLEGWVVIVLSVRPVDA